MVYVAHSGIYDASYTTETGNATRERASHFWDGVSKEDGADITESRQSPIFIEVRKQLLALPMLTEEQVSRIEIDRRHTIVLKDNNGDEKIPAFQFDESLKLHDSVVVVNEELAPDYDPWGTASWWNSAHTGLMLWDAVKGNYHPKPVDVVALPLAVNTLLDIIVEMANGD